MAPGLQRYTYTIFLDAINSTNREHAKAHALWPLLRCVAVAVDVAWCGGGGSGGGGSGV